MGFGGWILSLPPTPAAAAAPAIASEENAATLAALQPPKRERPLIPMTAISDATETAGYLMTYGILRRVDVGDVVALATARRRSTLSALTVEPDATIAQFDAAHPGGADDVIVPAMDRDDDPAAIAWLESQVAKGAIVVSVCAGAKMLGAAGLLDGRRATTHWYYLDELLENSPTIKYVADRRMVVDDRVATTTGITASMPMMLTLIEAIVGRKTAEEIAQNLGLMRWDARHASGEFLLTRPFVMTVLRNLLAFWNREELGIELRPGLDEVSLALAADAWSRTYRSEVVTFAVAPTETLSGVRILPDRRTAAWLGGPLVSTVENRGPVKLLDETLAAIAGRYGAPTARVVAMQLEYPRSGEVR
ncbi:MAG: transcriptional regulator [Rhodospirillales bacterium]|nr:transcriptional regulator [Rhodospirillales bacterium]